MASFCVKLLDTQAVMARKYLPVSLTHRCPAISVLSYWVALCTIDLLSTMRLARVGGRGSEKIGCPGKETIIQESIKRLRVDPRGRHHLVTSSARIGRLAMRFRPGDGAQNANKKLL